MKITFILIPAVLAIVGCATSSSSVEDARALFRTGEYQEGLEVLRSLSKTGEPAAHFDLANLYATGTHVPADHGQAEELWLKSCKGNYYPACTNIGQRYLYNGEYQDAEDVLLESARHGDRLAAEYLVELYTVPFWPGSSEAKARYWRKESRKDQ